MAAVLFYSNDFYSGDWETSTKKKKTVYYFSRYQKITITNTYSSI